MAFYQIKPKDITSSFALDYPAGTLAAGNNTDANADGITDPAAAIGDTFLTYSGTAGNNALQTNNALWLTFATTGAVNDQTIMYCNFDIPQLRPTPATGYGFLSTAAEAQRFRVWLRKTAANQGNVNPTVQFGVSIDGTTEAFSSLTTGTIRNAAGSTQGTTFNITSEVGEYFDYTWTVDPLVVDPDATNIHLVLTQTVGGGTGTGEPLRRRMEVGAVEWYAQFNDPVPYPPNTKVYFF